LTPFEFVASNAQTQISRLKILIFNLTMTGKFSVRDKISLKNKNQAFRPKGRKAWLTWYHLFSQQDRLRENACCLIASYACNGAIRQPLIR